MKKSLYILILVAVTGASCRKFLEESPAGILTENNFYKTEADAEAAVTAAYDHLNNQWDIYFRGIYLLAELPTDNAECGQGVANANIFALDGFTFGPVNDRIYVLYTALYKGIANANVAIDKIPAIDFNEAKKNRLVAEAKFVRALLYFNLVRLFGEVPLVVNQTTSLADINVPRASVETVYAQIIDDLQAGEQYLNESNGSADYGRATKAAASGLLSKVYLTIKDFPKAKEAAQKTIAYSGYGLLDSYFDIFTPENRFNKEAIFSVQNKGGTGTGNGFALALFLPRATIPLPGGGNVAGNSADVPTEEFYNSFRPGDLRKDRTFFTEYDAGAGAVTFRPHWYKYFDPATIANLGEGNLNYHVIRYADILLTYAEAINEIEGAPSAVAYDAINQVRRRAYGKPTGQQDASVDLSGLSQQGFRDALLDERRWEFGFEDHRWFDLVRTGNLINVLRGKGNTQIQQHHTLFPLPQRELDVNPLLTQNAGYLQ